MPNEATESDFAPRVGNVQPAGEADISYFASSVSTASSDDFASGAGANDAEQVKQLAGTMNDFAATGTPKKPEPFSTQYIAPPEEQSKELTLGTLAKGAKQVVGEVTAPLNVVAKPVGIAAGFVQKNVLRPFMVGMTKQMHKNAH